MSAKRVKLTSQIDDFYPAEEYANYEDMFILFFNEKIKIGKYTHSRIFNLRKELIGRDIPGADLIYDTKINMYFDNLETLQDFLNTNESNIRLSIGIYECLPTSDKTYIEIDERKLCITSFTSTTLCAFPVMCSQYTEMTLSISPLKNIELITKTEITSKYLFFRKDIRLFLSRYSCIFNINDVFTEEYLYTFANKDGFIIISSREKCEEMVKDIRNMTIPTNGLPMVKEGINGMFPIIKKICAQEQIIF